jgi:hypothetical protein
MPRKLPPPSLDILYELAADHLSVRDLTRLASRLLDKAEAKQAMQDEAERDTDYCPVKILDLG